MRIQWRRLAGYALVGALLVAANLLNNEIAPQAYLPVCVLTSVALITVARLTGCSWADLGLGHGTVRRGAAWGAVVFAAVLAGYAVLAALPELRDLLADRRVTTLDVGSVLFKAFIWVPFGTVLLEETAFRGVLYGLARRAYGHGIASATSSLLFGLWHLLPARDIARVNPLFADIFGDSAAGRLTAHAVAVAATALAGVGFCELRRRSGSLLAPMAAHWALNGIGYLVAYARR
jgi:membrane protease YdiL (CAAX protease family)